MKKRTISKTTLGEVVEFFNGKAVKASEVGTYPVYGSNGRIGFTEDFKYDNGIIIGRVGAYCGSIEYCSNKFWASDNTIVAASKCGPECNRYAAYLLIHLDLHRHAGGAAQPLLTQTNLRKVECPNYGKITQQKIAGLLSAYDDLIENNTRRIAILEEMAQAIYREWFVHYRFPGHEEVKRIDSPLGKIPTGFTPKNIGSVLDFQIGGGWGKDAVDEEFSNPGFVIRGTDIPDARSLRVVNCSLRYHSDSNIRSRKLVANDLVFEVSGGSKGQPVGRSLFVSDRLLRRFDGDVICASFCKLIRANPSQLAPEILYHYLLESYTNGTIEQYEVQSTGIKNFKFTVFLDSELVAIPPAEVQRDFVLHIRPLMDAVQVLGKKSEVLRSTRDLLLPKLISGQLDVDELDIETGEPLVEAVA